MYLKTLLRAEINKIMPDWPSEWHPEIFEYESNGDDEMPFLSVSNERSYPVFPTIDINIVVEQDKIDLLFVAYRADVTDYANFLCAVCRIYNQDEAEEYAQQVYEARDWHNNKHVQHVKLNDFSIVLRGLLREKMMHLPRELPTSHSIESIYSIKKIIPSWTDANSAAAEKRGFGIRFITDRETSERRLAIVSTEGLSDKQAEKIAIQGSLDGDATCNLALRLVYGR